jgi:hypothetical protein
MKNNIIFFIYTTILVTQVSFSKSIFNNSKWEKEKCSIKSIIQNEYSISNDTLQTMKLRLRLKKDFNKNGQLILQTNFNQLEEALKDTFLYNDSSQLIETIKYNTFGVRLSHTLITYDLTGKKTEQRVINEPSGTSFKQTFSYNSVGLLVNTNYYLPNDSLRLTLSNKYDKKGRLIWNNTDSKDEISNYYEYDHRNNVISISQLNKDNITISRYRFSYNCRNEKKTESKYNSSGNLIEKHKISIKYVYDSRGNWLSVGTYVDSRLTSFKSRKIEYFPN